MSQPDTTVQGSDPHANSDLLSLSDLDDDAFLQHLRAEWKSANQAQVPSTPFALRRFLALEQAMAIISQQAQESPANFEDDDELVSSDSPYSEPWNAQKMYQSIKDYLWMALEVQTKFENLQPFANEVDRRLRALKTLRRDSSTQDINRPSSSEIKCVLAKYEALPILKHELGLLDLPPEVLGEILILACSKNPYMALNVLEVSSGLREVALATPLLWTDISILAPLHITSLYLQRSKAVTIDVDVMMPNGYPFGKLDCRPHQDRFISLLAPHFGRIRKLVMVFTLLDLLSEAMSLVKPQSLLALEELDFGLHNCLPFWSGEGGFECRGLVQSRYYVQPSTRLTIRGLIFPHQNITYFPISVSLRHLELRECRRLEVGTLVSILKSLCQLRSLVMDSCEFPTFENSDEVRAGMGHVQVSSLTHLEMHWNSHHAAELISSHNSPISMPNLKSASISLFYEGIQSQESWLTELGEVYSGLTTLKLTGCVASSAAWSRAFQSWRSLVSLHLMSCELKDSDILVLAFPETELQIPMPELRSITFDNEIELSSYGLKKMVLGRLKALNPDGSLPEESMGIALDKLTIRGWDATRVDEEDLKDVAQYVRELRVGIFRSNAEDVLDEGSVSGSDSEWSCEDEQHSAYPYGSFVRI